MVVLGIVNMLLLWVGFLTGLRKESMVANRGGAGDSGDHTSQLTELAQKG